jgi:adenine-specific DNA-methyltransferase
VIDLRLGRWQDVLANVADGSVRLILTSPPYDNARTYEDTCEPVDFDELAAFCLRVLCPGGVVDMVLDGAVDSGVQSTTPYEVICSWAKMPGWRLLQVLAYGRRGAPGAYKGRFRRDHEPRIVMVKDGAPHVCEKDRIAERAFYKPSDRPSIRTRNGATKVGISSVDPAAIERSHRGSLWWYGATGHGLDPSSSTGHPATFAEAFALDAVNVWSNPGDLVCDPFAGACTVGKACKVLGRRFVGAERVGPCPRCGGGFPKRCECPPNGWLDYYHLGLRRLGDPVACERAAVAEAEKVGQLMLPGGSP